MAPSSILNTPSIPIPAIHISDWNEGIPCENCNHYGYPCLNCNTRDCEVCIEEGYTCENCLEDRPDGLPNPIYMPNSYTLA